MLFIPCTKALPNTIILFTLLLACTELLKSAPKIITFVPFPLLGCEKLPPESNPTPYPEYLYLSTSEFFVILIAPNRQFSKVILEVRLISRRYSKNIVFIRQSF